MSCCVCQMLCKRHRARIYSGPFEKIFAAVPRRSAVGDRHAGFGGVIPRGSSRAGLRLLRMCAVVTAHRKRHGWNREDGQRHGEGLDGLHDRISLNSDEGESSVVRPNVQT